MLSRCLAGALLGFPLAAALLRLLLGALPNGGAAYLIPALLLFFPLWFAVMTGAYFFRSGSHAWMTLGTANALAFGLLWLTHPAAPA